MVADGGKWNFVNVYTETKNNVFVSNTGFNGTMVFKDNGTVLISAVDTSFTSTWSATTNQITLFDNGDVNVYNFTESTAKSQKFSNIIIETVGGITTISNESFVLTK